jgi:hypothetical protein
MNIPIDWKNNKSVTKLELLLNKSKMLDISSFSRSSYCSWVSSYPGPLLISTPLKFSPVVLSHYIRVSYACCVLAVRRNTLSLGSIGKKRKRTKWSICYCSFACQKPNLKVLRPTDETQQACATLMKWDQTTSGNFE